MIAVYWEQIIRWQGQKQGDKLGGNYNNPGMRRWYLSTSCAFTAVCIVYRHWCKGPFGFIFQSVFFSPVVQIFHRREREKSMTSLFFLAITGSNMNLACIWHFTVFKPFLYVLPHLALTMACLVGDSFQVYKTCQGHTAGPFSSVVCILASVKTYKLSSDQ